MNLCKAERHLLNFYGLGDCLLPRLCFEFCQANTLGLWILQRKKALKTISAELWFCILFLNPNL